MKDLDKGIEILVYKSENLFIYAQHMVQEISKKNNVSLEELAKFPDGIKGFYEDQFGRILGNRTKHFDLDMNYNDWISSCEWNIIQTAMVSQEP